MEIFQWLTGSAMGKCEVEVERLESGLVDLSKGER